MWMYNKRLKRDVFCAKVDSLVDFLSLRHYSNTGNYEVSFFNPEKSEWSIARLEDFEPPRENH